MNSQRHSVIYKAIIEDNEAVAQAAYQRGDYIGCFLLIHSLVESLLRAFLTKTKRESFNELITAYKKYLQRTDQQDSTFVDELTKFNQRRNRVIHGLFIEWLETFDPEITDFGFEYE